MARHYILTVGCQLPLLTKHSYLPEVPLPPHLHKVAIQLEVSFFHTARNFKQVPPKKINDLHFISLKPLLHFFIATQVIINYGSFTIL